MSTEDYPMSSTEAITIFEIGRQAQNQYGSITVENVRKVCEQNGMSEQQIREILEKLNLGSQGGNTVFYD